MTGFFVFLGGGIGAFLRWLVTTGIHNHWGTMLVNVAGAFLIGVLYGCLSSGAALKPEVRLFLMTGPVSYTHLRAHETPEHRGLGDVYKRQ